MFRKATCACVLLAAIFSASAQQQANPDSLYEIQDSVLIKTSDGHDISSIIVMKKGTTQRLPAILFFTPYDQGSSDSFFGKISADNDYVGIVSYTRGIRTDLSDFFPYEHDGDDAYDVIDWISKQPWCDGRVGMFGGSYVGFVQWSTVKRSHPALKTIVPQVPVMPGFDAPMENNVPQGFALSWPNGILYDKPLPADLNQTWYERGSSYRSLDSLAERPNRIFQKWLQHPDYDRYWRSLVPTPAEYAAIDIPILCTTGYFDGAQIGALEYVKQYFTYNKHPQLYFVIGPYDHWGGQRGSAPDTLMSYPIDPVARKSMRGLAFEWFDFVFKGKQRPELLKDKVNYEVMGANDWRHAPSLAAMSNATLTFYLSDSRKGDRYSLTTVQPNKQRSLEQVVDFEDRTSQNNYYTPFIINDSLDASNGLVFATEPLTEPFALSGSFYGMVNASINKRDMDISVAFYEQMPNGQYFSLTRYLGRASYAKDNTKRELLTPYQQERIPLRDTRMVCKTISKGSRLVIVLNINKHPFEEINYGTGNNVHDETIENAGEPLQVRWFTDSFIRVPVWKEDK